MPTTCLFLTRIGRRLEHLNYYASSCGHFTKHFSSHVQITPNPKKERFIPLRIRRLKCPSFNWQYSPNHEPFGHVQTYLADPYHILYHKYKRKYEKRRRDTLWWTALTGISTSSKSVVRNHCSRKMKAGFIKALQARGFDQDGRIPASEEHPDGQVGIIGSVRLTCVKPMITIDSAALDVECLVVLDNVIALSKRAQRQRSRTAHSTSSSMLYRSNSYP